MFTSVALLTATFGGGCSYLTGSYACADRDDCPADQFCDLSSGQGVCSTTAPLPEDGGRPVDDDAGTPTDDSGAPIDAGTPPADAGTPPADSGVSPDAGTPADGGASSDGGTPPADGGAAVDGGDVDAGDAPDAGLDQDAGVLVDAGPVTGCRGEPWRDMDASSRYLVQVEGGDLAADLPINDWFAMPVTLRADRFDYGLADVTLDEGDVSETNLNVTFPDGSPAGFEIDTWNPGGDSVLWVMMPFVPEGVCLHIYLKDQRNGYSAASWPGLYDLVMHGRPGATGCDLAVDSAQGQTPTCEDQNLPTEVVPGDAVLGAGVRTEEGELRFGDLEGNWPNQGTLTFWMKRTNDESGDILDRSGGFGTGSHENRDYFHMWMEDPITGPVRIRARGIEQSGVGPVIRGTVDRDAPSTNAWSFVSFSWRRDDMTLTIDGSSDTDMWGSNLNLNSQEARFFRNLDALVDEVQLTNDRRNAARLRIEERAQSDGLLLYETTAQAQP
jgi:hypothetical protein